MDFFKDFTPHSFTRGDIRIHYRRAGQGAPVLLLHGYPQTHVCWHQVAPRLAEQYTVICPDLRGYGDSSKPPGLPDHANYSKREMAQDMHALMTELGWSRYHLIGHDRGARVSHRLALDHSEAVHSLAILDVSPTLKMYESTNLELAKAYYHWYLMLQPTPLPERLLAGHVPLTLMQGAATAGRNMANLSKFSEVAMSEYVRVFADPAAIHASCEDYRASGGIDLEHDRADRDAGRRLHMPVLALWGANGVVGQQFDCLANWREVAHDVQGQALPCGHFLPEEAPEETYNALHAFLQRHPLPA